VDTENREVTIAHERIPGLMEAMMMALTVREPSLLAGLRRGDIVRGRLVLAPEGPRLEAIAKIGSRNVASGREPPTPSRQSDPILEGDRVPDTVLIDHLGRRRRLHEETTRALVLTFVYTRCPFQNFCPLMDQRFRMLQDAIAADPSLSRRARLLSVTLDLPYDTSAVLKQHADRIGVNDGIWLFAAPEDGTLAARFGVAANRDDQGGQAIVHRLITVVIEPGGVVARILRGGEWRPQQVTDLLRVALSKVASR